MTGRTDAEESQIVKFEHQLHEVSRSIKLAASTTGGGNAALSAATCDSRVYTIRHKRYYTAGSVPKPIIAAATRLSILRSGLLRTPSTIACRVGRGRAPYGLGRDNLSPLPCACALGIPPKAGERRNT